MDAVMTCFSYTYNNKYRINPIIARRDLDKMVSILDANINIYVLTDIPEELLLDIAEKGTIIPINNRERYEIEMSRLSEMAPECLILYWSCHSYIDRIGRMSIICPEEYGDTSFLSGVAISSLLHPAAHKGIEILCIVDCCSAEGLIPLKYRLERGGRRSSPLQNLPDSPSDIIALCGSSMGEMCGFFIDDEEEAVSIFTSVLVSFLESNLPGFSLYYMEGEISERMKSIREDRGCQKQTLCVMTSSPNRCRMFMWAFKNGPSDISEEVH